MADHPTEDPTLEDYLLEWLDRRASQLRPITVHSYRQLITAYLVPELGRRRLGDLDRRTLQSFYARLLHSGGQTGRGLSARTVHYVHSVLHRALQDAVVEGLLVDNPARLARPPKRHPHGNEVDEGPDLWRGEQAAAFLAFVDDHPWRALWHLALGTGAARSELLGLRWCDVDLDGGQVLMQRSLSVVDGVPQLLATTSCTRRLSVGPSVVEALRRQEHMRRQREMAPGSQDRWGLVIANGVGDPVDPRLVTDEFAALVRRAPVPVIRFRDLRRVHATLLQTRQGSADQGSQRAARASHHRDDDGRLRPRPARDGP